MSRDIATHIADDGVATLTLSRPERQRTVDQACTRSPNSLIAGRRIRPSRGRTHGGPTFCAGFDSTSSRKPISGGSIKDSSHRTPAMAFPRRSRRQRPRGGGRLDLCAVRLSNRLGHCTFGHPKSNLVHRPCLRRCNGSSVWALRANCA
jgi:hypothetical protein